MDDGDPSLPALHPETHLNPLCVLKEARADGHQGVLWPLVEPVDSRAVDHSREFSCSHSQDGAHRGETQDHLEVDTEAALWGRQCQTVLLLQIIPFRRETLVFVSKCRGWGVVQRTFPVLGEQCGHCMMWGCRGAQAPLRGPLQRGKDGWVLEGVGSWHPCWAARMQVGLAGLVLAGRQKSIATWPGVGRGEGSHPTGHRPEGREGPSVHSVQLGQLSQRSPRGNMEGQGELIYLNVLYGGGAHTENSSFWPQGTSNSPPPPGSPLYSPKSFPLPV